MKNCKSSKDCLSSCCKEQQPFKMGVVAKAMANRIKKAPKWQVQAKTEGLPIAWSRGLFRFIAAILTGLWPMLFTVIQGGGDCVPSPPATEECYPIQASMSAVGIRQAWRLPIRGGDHSYSGQLQKAG